MLQRLVSGLCAAAVALAAVSAAAAPPVDPAHGAHGDEVRGFGTGAEATHEAEHPAQHHVPHFGDINWYYGVLGAKPDAEPSLLWRPEGMPPPLGAMLLNSGLLFFVLIRFGRRPIAEALKKRKALIMTGMDEAARMKDEAAQRLADYEEKLKHVDEEIERVKREMREAGEIERARILKEARERQARMERDARLVVEQELKAARELLMQETVRAAVSSAERRIAERLTPADHQRLADEYLQSIGRPLGGQA